MPFRFLLLISFFFLSPAFANSYRRGGFYCHDFQRAERGNRSDPTIYAGDYALCLIARNQGDDVTAIAILDSEIRNGNIAAARIKAVYIATGGAMDGSLDDRNYDEALNAYGKVLLLINLQPDYPKGFVITELKEQHELEAYTYMVHLSYNKSMNGMLGSHNTYLLQSPSYTGDRDLKEYPQYAPYTVASLKQTIEHADICANLPRKRHFKALLYRQTIAWCQLMKKTAKQLVPIEIDRLTVLSNPSCVRDIEKCSQYQDILNNQIMPLIRERREADAKIYKAKSIAELASL